MKLPNVTLVRGTFAWLISTVYSNLHIGTFLENIFSLNSEQGLQLMDDDRWFQSYSLVYVTVKLLSMKKQIRYTFHPLTIDPGTRGWRIFESAFAEPPHLKIMRVKLEILPHKREHQHEAPPNHWNHLVIPCRIPTSGKTQPLNLQRLKTRLGTWQPSIVEKNIEFSLVQRVLQDLNMPFDELMTFSDSWASWPMLIIMNEWWLHDSTFKLKPFLYIQGYNSAYRGEIYNSICN